MSFGGEAPGMPAAGTVAFAIEDTTSYNALRPLVEALEGDDHVDCEVLWLDSLYPPESGRRVSAEVHRRHDHRLAESFMKRDEPVFSRFPDGLRDAMVQKLLVDRLSHRPFYDTAGYLDAVDPDVLVAAMDSIPFLRHLIRDAGQRGVETLVLQHGVYPNNLDASVLAVRNGVLSPSFDPVLPPLERLKRRLLYPYGFSVYTNPFVGEVLTMGTFFQRRIAALREEYPCDGTTPVTVTGSPEFDGGIQPYEPRTDSVLYLSQQTYESGFWTEENLDWHVDRLGRLDEIADVTVRPHPKDSTAKMDRYREQVAVSEEPSLAADIANYDVILASHSTALFEGVVQGKVCGVLTVPWDDTETHQAFEPFTHRHIVQVRPGTEDLDRAAAERSIETQREYLRRFCYTPSAFEVDGSSSTELVLDRIRERLDERRLQHVPATS